MHAAGVQLDDTFFVGAAAQPDILVIGIIFPPLYYLEGGIEGVGSSRQKIASLIVRPFFRPPMACEFGMTITYLRFSSAMFHDAAKSSFVLRSERKRSKAAMLPTRSIASSGGTSTRPMLFRIAVGTKAS